MLRCIRIRSPRRVSTVKNPRFMLLAALVMCLAGGGIWYSYAAANNDPAAPIPGEMPPIGDAPDVLMGPHFEPSEAVLQWFASHLAQRGAYVKTFDGWRVVLVAAGEKPTGGYLVEVEQLGKSAGEKWILDVRFVSPAPGDMVTEAITYPYIALAIRDDGSPLVVRDVTAGTPDPVAMTVKVDR
jgi:hypothetical protein